MTRRFCLCGPYRAARQTAKKLFTPIRSFSSSQLSQCSRGLSQRHGLSCCATASFTFCSYHKHLVCSSSFLPFPLALSGGPVWSQAASVYCVPPVVSPHSVHSECCNLDVHTSHQGSVICTRSICSRTLLPTELILPLAPKRNLKHIFSAHPILVPFS